MAAKSIGCRYSMQSSKTTLGINRPRKIMRLGTRYFIPVAIYFVFMRAISNIIWYFFFPFIFIKFICSTRFGFFPCNLSIILIRIHTQHTIVLTTMHSKLKTKNFQFFLSIDSLSSVLFVLLFISLSSFHVCVWLKMGVGERCLHAIHLFILLVHSNTVIHFVDGSQTDTKVFN